MIFGSQQLPGEGDAEFLSDLDVAVITRTESGNKILFNSEARTVIDAHLISIQTLRNIVESIGCGDPLWPNYSLHISISRKGEIVYYSNAEVTEVLGSIRSYKWRYGDFIVLRNVSTNLLNTFFKFEDEGEELGKLIALIRLSELSIVLKAMLNNDVVGLNSKDLFKYSEHVGLRKYLLRTQFIDESLAEYLLATSLSRVLSEVALCKNPKVIRRLRNLAKSIYKRLWPEAIATLREVILISAVEALGKRYNPYDVIQQIEALSKYRRLKTVLKELIIAYDENTAGIRDEIICRIRSDLSRAGVEEK